MHHIHQPKIQKNLGKKRIEKTHVTNLKNIKQNEKIKIKGK